MMSHSLRISGTLALLATIGCGPPRIGVGPSDDESDSSEVSSDSTSTGETSTSESTTSPEPTDSETSSDEWTSADFIPDEDVWVADQCDPYEQDCPDGEKCVPYGSTGGNWDANKCVPIMGDGEPGEPCWYGGVYEATDDCDATSVCWDVMAVDGEAIGTCHSLCTGTADNPECPVGSSCLIASDSSVNICIFNCSPILQDCGRGLACFWANGNFNCIFTTQDIPAGEPCGFINDCAKGLSCTTAEVLPSCEGSACCTLFCDVELGDQQCEAMPGTSCVPFFEDGQAPPGYELLGLCMLP
jgi:hypothetical protein